jgi:hypothetical protein
MSSNEKISPPKVKPSRWGHPLVFLASAIGLAGSSFVYYAQIRARQKARSLFFFKSNFRLFYSTSLDLFLETPFYEEALELTRGYKHISEKLVEPIQPLQIDPTSKFNAISQLEAQVSLLFQISFFFFFYYYYY